LEKVLIWNWTWTKINRFAVSVSRKEITVGLVDSMGFHGIPTERPWQSASNRGTIPLEGCLSLLVTPV